VNQLIANQLKERVQKNNNLNRQNNTSETEGSPRNENVNLLVQIKFLNLFFIYIHFVQ
jgi:hypothetical protein